MTFLDTLLGISIVAILALFIMMYVANEKERKQFLDTRQPTKWFRHPANAALSIILATMVFTLGWRIYIYRNGEPPSRGDVIVEGCLLNNSKIGNCKLN